MKRWRPTLSAWKTYYRASLKVLRSRSIKGRGKKVDDFIGGALRAWLQIEKEVRELEAKGLITRQEANARLMSAKQVTDFLIAERKKED